MSKSYASIYSSTQLSRWCLFTQPMPSLNTLSSWLCCRIDHATSARNPSQPTKTEEKTLTVRQGHCTPAVLRSWSAWLRSSGLSWRSMIDFEVRFHRSCPWSYTRSTTTTAKLVERSSCHGFDLRWRLLYPPSPQSSTYRASPSNLWAL